MPTEHSALDFSAFKDLASNPRLIGWDHSIHR